MLEGTQIKLTEKQSYALASYIAAYIQEELDRGISLNDIRAPLIWQAIDAYQGGAR